MTNRQALRDARRQGHKMERIPGTHDQDGSITYACVNDDCIALMRIENYNAQTLYGWDEPCGSGDVR
jgi:hypothetical protein